MWSRAAACLRLRDLVLTLAKTDKVFLSFRLIKKWSSIGTLLGVHHSDQGARTSLKSFHEDIFIESQHSLLIPLTLSRLASAVAVERGAQGLPGVRLLDAHDFFG